MNKGQASSTIAGTICNGRLTACTPSMLKVCSGSHLIQVVEEQQASRWPANCLSCTMKPLRPQCVGVHRELNRWSANCLLCTTKPQCGDIHGKLSRCGFPARLSHGFSSVSVVNVERMGSHLPGGALKDAKANCPVATGLLCLSSFPFIGAFSSAWPFIQTCDFFSLSPLTGLSLSAASMRRFLA